MNRIIVDKKSLIKVLKYESKNYGLKSHRYPIFAFKENQLLYKYNYILRKYEYYFNSNKKFFQKIFRTLLTRYQRKMNIFIPENVFDEGLKFIHLGQRLVNGNAIVGKNCVMHINTNIVAGGTNEFSPVIGDNVILGISSIISGKAKIGNNVAIGANSFVNKEFKEDNITLGGSPAKIISNKSRKDWKK